MIDTDNFVYILYFDIFQKLEISTNDLTPMTFSLTRFTGNSISPLGIVNIHVTFGDEPCSKIIITKFMMVDIPSAYNVVIGRPMLNRLRAMVST